MRVDCARLWEELERFAAIGATPEGGVERIALTEQDARGRERLTERAIAAGCGVRVDAIGNVFCRREGADPHRAPVMIGSHLDSQPGGGRFDGALGVIAGLEVMRVIAERDVTLPAPIELVDWTDEEGARFGVSCIGSSAFSGALELSAALALEDADGMSVGAALERGALAGPARVGEPRPAAYLELHIEQGPILEEEGVTIGVVEGVVGISWLSARIAGATGHAGTTPLAGRRDALLAAAELIGHVHDVAARHAPLARGSVCAIEARPNAGSVIVGETKLLVDLRHFDASELAAMKQEVVEALERLERRGYETWLEPAWEQPPIAFDEGCLAAIETAADSLGHSTRRMLSGAGHDAGYVAQVAPAAMIFVPCAGGVSHNPLESVTPADAEAGANVLLNASLALAA